MVVEPGPFRTDFAGRSLTISKREIPDYAQTAGKRKERNDPHTEWKLGNPDKAAKTLIDLADSDSVPFRLLLGGDAVRLAREHYNAMLAETEQFSNYSLSTDED